MKYEQGYVRFELIGYKDVKLQKGWKTTEVILVPKTPKIEKMKKIVPNIEKLFEEEEKKTEKKVKKYKVIEQDEVEPMIED